MKIPATLLAGALGLMLGATPAFSQDTDASAAQKLFQQRCGACHQATGEKNGVGPNLSGVVGRAAGQVDGFKYSTALRASGLTWTAETLDTFLTNPGKLVRGTRMTQRFANLDERKAIIDFLSAQ